MQTIRACASGAAQDGQVQHARAAARRRVAAEAADEARVLLAQHPAVTERLAGRCRRRRGRSSTVVMTRSARAAVRCGAGCPACSAAAQLHRADDRRVAGAAADLPGDRLPDLRPRRDPGCGRAGPGRSSSCPGVQKPHCRPWHCMKPCWTGSSSPSRSRPSTVRTSCPPAIAASTVHDFTGSPSSQHHAGAAVAGVAAPVGAGQAELVAQEVHQQQPALDLPGDLGAVDGHRHLHVTLPFRSGDAGDGACAAPAGSARRPGAACSPRCRAGRSAGFAAPRPRARRPRRTAPRTATCPRSARGDRRQAGRVGARRRPGRPGRRRSRRRPSRPRAPQDTTAQSPARRSTFS